MFHLHDVRQIPVHRLGLLDIILGLLNIILHTIRSVFLNNINNILNIMVRAG